MRRCSFISDSPAKAPPDADKAIGSAGGLNTALATVAQAPVARTAAYKFLSI
jgi:hypothetical protein